MKFKRFALAFSIVVFSVFAFNLFADNLVILHTNDTHSNIDPDKDGKGGILQRKAIIDSVRKAEKNVILIDAGDMVQGSLYFNYFGGDVEYPLMNMMNYDIRILGNHEFDNGLKSLAEHYKDVKAARLSANYDFSGTPLKGMFEPYIIKKVGGKKFGFIGLNIDPKSLIAADNYSGMKYSDMIQTANKYASMLKHEKKCDLVVAVTHIGVDPASNKDTDYDLARNSKDIDIIIGGHSHTVIYPDNKGSNPSVVENSDGKPVLVAQTGKYGKYIGYIRVDLDNLNKSNEKDYKYELIPVTDRFPKESLDKKMANFIAPYRNVIDSVNNMVIAWSLYDLNSDDRNGGYANFAGDFAKWYGQLVLDSLADGSLPAEVDLGFMNVGGIRQNMPKGNVTRGEIMSTFPFANKMTLLEMKGKDILEAMQVSAEKGGEAVSWNVRIALDSANNVKRVIVDGKDIDPDKTYIVSTINYIAAGNDNLKSFANSRVIWTDTQDVIVPILRYVESFTKNGLPIAPDLGGRFQKEVIIQ